MGEGKEEGRGGRVGGRGGRKGGEGRGEEGSDGEGGEEGWGRNVVNISSSLLQYHQNIATLLLEVVKYDSMLLWLLAHQKIQNGSA